MSGDLTAMLAGVVYLIYIFGRLYIEIATIFTAAPHWLTVIVGELKPLFGLSVMVWIPVTLMSGRTPGWFDYLIVAQGILIFFAPDSDDRWKRRSRKLHDKVTEIGGRLTVVPVGGN